MLKHTQICNAAVFTATYIVLIIATIQKLDKSFTAQYETVSLPSTDTLAPHEGNVGV